MRSILIGSIIAAWRFPKEIILRQSFKRAFLTCINAFLRSPVYTFMSENNPLGRSAYSTIRLFVSNVPLTCKAAIVMMFLQENTFYIHQGIGTDIVVRFLVSLTPSVWSSNFCRFRRE